MTGRMLRNTQELSDDELASVSTVISDDIPIQVVAQKWAEIDRDAARIGELNKAARGIMGTRLTNAVLALWGKAGDVNLSVFETAKTSRVRKS